MKLFISDIMEIINARAATLTNYEVLRSEGAERFHQANQKQEGERIQTADEQKFADCDPRDSVLA